MSGRDELIAMSACEAVTRLKAGDVSPVELVDAAAARIEAVNPAVNAIPTLCLDLARDTAKAMPKPDSPESGWLAGLPVMIKEVNEVAGVRTTYGSPIFVDHVPAHDDLMVDTLKRRGAVVLGKSNIPEFAAGANTFNEVFGKTRNPWDTDMTCGGSSGGSAVSVATGMSWLATGNDLGGSLRTPASFCSVVGLRPSVGRVAQANGLMSQDAYQSLVVEGPIGRDVADVALMLDAQSGHNPQDPKSLAAPASPFLQSARAPRAPKRVGFSPNLGIGPMDREVAAICSAAAARFADGGSTVEDAAPDFTGAMDIFQTLRAALFATIAAPLLDNHREQLKPEMVWQVEKGMALSSGEVGRASVARTGLYQRVAAWFEDYDVLALPAATVAPFDVNIRYIEEVDGHVFDNYVDWIYITYAITLTGCPAISVPAGFTESGLPVGIQLVGRPYGEAELLSYAAQLEEILALGKITPVDPKAPISRT
ncbi:MAG: amidase [Alphaproteobacteria bacterium]|nr:amidase [Alphaproteobacteria bacterium]